jgi:hypothetical protein
MICRKVTSILQKKADFELYFAEINYFLELVDFVLFILFVNEREKLRY